MPGAYDRVEVGALAPTGTSSIYLYKCFDRVLQIVRTDQVEVLNCPVDPLILSTVSRNRPLLPYDSVSKSTLGPLPPPIVPTWPDLGSDSAHFAQLWSKFRPDCAHVAQFWRPIVFAQFGSKATLDSAHLAQFGPR